MRDENVRRGTIAWFVPPVVVPSAMALLWLFYALLGPAAPG